MGSWKRVVVQADTPILEVIARIDESALQVALVVDEKERLIGVITDGDVRRTILKNIALSTPCSAIISHAPTTAKVGIAQHEMLSIMRRYRFHHLPLVDDIGRVVDLVTLESLLDSRDKENWVVLMAGGLGSRLRPLTENCPKPLLEVGGRPILESIMRSFIEQGFRKFFLSVNYKAEMISDYFGDGSKWGVQIEYLHETTRLGTAGALSLLPSPPQAPVFVMNGDLLTRADFKSMLAFHNQHDAEATMAVREYDFQVPYGVVNVDGSHILDIVEKPVQRFFVNAGIYVLSPSAFNRIPKDAFFDMPTLFSELIESKRETAAFPLREYWLDIGRIEEFERAQLEYTKFFCEINLPTISS